MGTLTGPTSSGNRHRKVSREVSSPRPTRPRRTSTASRASSKGKRRPAFEELKRRVQARDVDAVIYWKQDRITRQQHEFWHLVELCKPSGKKGDAGATLHAPGDTAAGYVDLTTSGGLLNAGMGALLSQHTGALMRDCALSKFRQKAAAGEWLGGTRPFGWNVA